jgi:hypothetical protein
LHPMFHVQITQTRLLILFHLSKAPVCRQCYFIVALKYSALGDSLR